MAADTHRAERDSIQQALIESLKECQTRFGGGQELAVESDARVVKLCCRFEQAFSHGIRRRRNTASLGGSSLTDMVRGLLNTEDASNPSQFSPFFSFISSFLSKHELLRFETLKQVKTDEGRARSWLRCALNEHTLEKYLVRMLSESEKDKIERYYESWAFVRDSELCALLESIAAGTNSILFALNIDSPKLDPDLETLGPISGPTVTASSDIDGPAPVISPEASSEIQIKKKKKKRTVINLESSNATSVPSPSDADGSYLHQIEKAEIVIGSPVSSHASQGLTPISDTEGEEFETQAFRHLIPLRLDGCLQSNEEETQSNRSVKSDITNSCSILNNSTSLSEGELREALESLLERRKQLEGEVDSLRKDLHSERERSNKLNDKIIKIELKSNGLSCENEMLKRQLKKYVEAVQMLRSGNPIQELSSLDSLPGVDECLSSSAVTTSTENSTSVHEESSNLGYVVDPTDYESKLVQVAQMHAELMEFNERLQKQLLLKESNIRRLKETLTDLRGPLAFDEDSSDEASITSDCDVHSHSNSINIWIPSAFLTGNGSDAFHVYQVFIRVGDDEWNVYRRYSQFFALHRSLSKQNPQLFSTFDFPPKKTIKNKGAKLVQDRRKRLQRYLRCVINYYLQNDPTLSQNLERCTLIDVLPFFSDREQAHVRERRRSPSRRPAPQPASYYNGL